MTLSRPISATLSIAAAFAMTASPIAAAPLGAVPSVVASPIDQSAKRSFDTDALSFDHYRGYRRHRHRHGVDAGDVIAGIAVVGVLAAIASAASQPRRERRYPDYDYDRRDDRRDRSESLRDERQRYSNSGAGIERAVERCLERVERDVRVESVEEVRRNGEGWLISGALFNGEGFSCRTDADGRVRSVDYGESFASATADRGQTANPQDNQWDDERYRAAWERQRQTEEGA